MTLTEEQRREKRKKEKRLLWYCLIEKLWRKVHKILQSFAPRSVVNGWPRCRIKKLIKLITNDWVHLMVLIVHKIHMGISSIFRYPCHGIGHQYNWSVPGDGLANMWKQLARCSKNCFALGNLTLLVPFIVSSQASFSQNLMLALQFHDGGVKTWELHNSQRPNAAKLRIGASPVIDIFPNIESYIVRNSDSPMEESIRSCLRVYWARVVDPP